MWQASTSRVQAASAANRPEHRQPREGREQNMNPYELRWHPGPVLNDVNDCLRDEYPDQHG